MRIFVFEFITGGGLFSDPAAPMPHGSLLDEGRAMTQAITADLLAVGRTEVWTTRDARLPPLHPAGCQVTSISTASGEQHNLLQLATAADWTLLIAPETGGALLDRVRLVEMVSGRLLSPRSNVVKIAGNKQFTADWLCSHNVRVPSGRIVIPGERPTRANPPAVLKPIDGCGSQAVCLIDSQDAMELAMAALDRPMRLEVFVPGLAASVAVMCGPGQLVALPACQQRLTTDGRFGYLGGRTSLAADLDRRARQLALAAVATLPNPVGYVGVDLVLGKAGDGSGDYVIEINPRLTTSYVGLRAVCRENLASAMLAIAQGRPVALSFDPEPVEFDVSGKISRDAIA